MQRKLLLQWIVKPLHALCTWLWRFLPLTVFVGYAARADVADPARWLTAFTIGGLTAAAQIFWQLKTKVVLPRLGLGVNLYLCIGALGSIFHFAPLLQLLDGLRESGIFICMLLVGLYTTFYSSAGYIGCESAPAPAVRRCSIQLLVVTTCALALSVYCKGNIPVSAALPILALVFSNKFLRGRIQKGY